MSIIPPGYAEVIIPLAHSALARPAMITYGIQINDVPDVAGANAHTNTFDTAWDDRLASEVTIGPAVIRVGQDGGEALVVTGTTTQTGDMLTETASANTALLIRKITARGGRRGRGRLYMPWSLTESVVNENGRIPGANLADYQTTADNWLAGVEAITHVDAMVVLHNEGQSSPGLPNVVTALVCDPIVGSQRRRLGR